METFWDGDFNVDIFVGTWGSHSKNIRRGTSGSAPSSGKSTPLPHQQESISSSSTSSKGKKASGTRSGSTSRSNSRSNSVERRRSGSSTVGNDDTASPTRKSALLDAFRPRSKSDASKTRKPSIIANMKNAVQVRVPFENTFFWVFYLKKLFCDIFRFPMK